MYSSLRVTTAPAIEPVSLDEAKRHLRLDTDGEDDLIPGFISAAREIAESQLNRALITQTLTWTMSQDPPSGALPLLPMPLLILPVILTAPQVMNRPLELPRCPVQSIVSVSQADTDGTEHVLTTDDWIADLALDPARLRLNWTTMPRYLQHIQVVFVAGYGDNATDVPEPIRAAIKLLVAWLYEHRGDDAAEIWPKAVDYLLSSRRVFSFGG